jgi:Leucine-rich repeat (LRR) protein
MSGIDNLISRDRTNDYYLNFLLTGTLDLSDFINLKIVEVEGQSITSLILINCPNLEKVCANDNLLEEIILPPQLPQLERISLINNNLPARNLTCFSYYPNLKFLYLGTNDANRIRQGIYNR